MSCIYANEIGVSLPRGAYAADVNSQLSGRSGIRCQPDERGEGVRSLLASPSVAPLSTGEGGAEGPSADSVRSHLWQR